MDLKVFTVLNIIILMMTSLIYCSQPQDTTVEPIDNLNRTTNRTEVWLLEIHISEIFKQLSQSNLQQYSVKRCLNCILAVLKDAKYFTDYCNGKGSWTPSDGCANVPDKNKLCGDIRSLYLGIIYKDFDDWDKNCVVQPDDERKTIFKSIPAVIKCRGFSRPNSIYSMCLTKREPNEDSDDGNGKTDVDDVISDK
ncbi:uncharacterized protein LOC142334111 [Lycorma delicatula]|uniref:uncharacterized protein LOC142334111 n=1 Tax=Lycorma delicatula TaxID=130591 RepID=UPI003F5132A5